MSMVFVNLPVRDLAAARAFFTEVGFTFDDGYSDDQAACLVLADNAFAMLLAAEKFKEFVTGDVVDATQGTEMILCVTAPTREQVDETVRRALAAGGRPWQPATEIGDMYWGSFQDPDGHAWEVLCVPPAGQGGQTAGTTT